MPKMFSDPEAIAEDIIRDVGSDLVVGLPLGLGKANHIVNALYRRAVADRAISLTLILRFDAGKAEAIESHRAPFHLPRDRAAVRRLSRSRICQCAACGRAAAQCSGDRVFLSRGQVAACSLRAAALYLSQLYPCRVISAGARAQCRHAAGGEARRGRRDALQPELQHRHHAGCAARPRAGPRRVQACRPGEFAIAVHAGGRRSRGRSIQRGPRQSRNRFSAVRAAVRAGQRYQICHRAAGRGPGARRRHTADRHRPGRRRAGAGADRAPPRQCAVSGHPAAACTGRAATAGAGNRPLRGRPVRRQRNAVRGR
jgi:hypothetical protein